MRVLVVDDHPAFRRALTSALRMVKGIEVAGEAFEAETANRVNKRMRELQESITGGKWQELAPACDAAFPAAGKTDVTLPEGRLDAQLACEELAEFASVALEGEEINYGNELAAYRRRHVGPEENRALAACVAFEGDVLLVESEHDDVVPRPAVTSFRAAFGRARSLTYRVIEGADHALSQEPWQQAYTSLLLNWATEMVLGAREDGAAPGVHTHVQPAPRRGPPTAA